MKSSAEGAIERQTITPAYLFLLWLAVTQVIWAFAFGGDPASNPEWLRRARLICFGADESGLPDTRGWMLLVLAPLSFLVALVVTYGSDLGAVLRATISRRRLTAALLIFLVATSVWLASAVSKHLANGFALRRAQVEGSANLGSLPENYPKLNRSAPDFLLINQLGQEMRLADFRGQPLILTFIFAHCETVCPLIMQSVNSAAALTPPPGVKIVYLTLDPRRDTPSALPELARKWNLPPNAYILSGETPKVEKALAAYNVGAQRDERTGMINHPPLVYVIDQNGLISYALNAPPENWISDAVNRVLTGK